MVRFVGWLLCLASSVCVGYLPAQAQSSDDNLQQYTPSALFVRGQWELKHFSNVYVQTRAFNNRLQKDGNRSPGQQVYATIIHQFLYGY